ncbi:hypothetical protein BJX99DRAFT_255700 [Aspergillus californicus]
MAVVLPLKAWALVVYILCTTVLSLTINLDDVKGLDPIDEDLYEVKYLDPADDFGLANKLSTETHDPDNWLAYDNMGTRTDLNIIDLEDGNSTTGLALNVKTPIKVCTGGIMHGDCSDIHDSKKLAHTIASVLRGQSDNHSCSRQMYLVDNLRVLSYVTGRHCDTTAEHDTIAGAIYHYTQTMYNGRLCGTTCLRLDHGGTWRAYLKIADERWWDSYVHCEDKMGFDICKSGGNNDI